MADLQYYLPDRSQAEYMIRKSKMANITGPLNNPRGERFDCDDFSLILKARCAFEAYRDSTEKYSFNNLPNHPMCLGIVWGMLPFPFPHSLNWVVTEDENEGRKLHFIEPQKQKIIPSERYQYYRYIHFMMV